MMNNKENRSPSFNGGFGANTTTISATGQTRSNGGVFASMYSPFFNEDPSRYEGFKYTTNSETLNQNQCTQYSHEPSTVRQKHQDMVNQHRICLSRFMEASRELETLREENSQLRAMNMELQKQMSLVLQASLENRFGSDTMPYGFALGLSGFHIGENSCSDWNVDDEDEKENEEEEEEDEVSEESPRSVIENNGGGDDVERFSLPKSISVRSNGYLKTGQCGAGVGNGNRKNTKGATRSRASSSTAAPPEVLQKVYVRGGKEEEEPLEMVVYNQGMSKTELCKQWQETGTCSYEDHCQFAHGIEELRPVIRHPRYKTEVCRMVLAGNACPYGHRCHFRHALTEEEKAVALAQPKIRTMKLER
ncbi:hypothetical protein RIF29_03729 [Crotalaria pallida]|uniref:C3H1-type domain-containing protein n=1 Tax=Crotalaria pallida TaxID=3830 RepID=A0AAN9J087_CROPI